MKRCEHRGPRHVSRLFLVIVKRFFFTMAKTKHLQESTFSHSAMGKLVILGYSWNYDDLGLDGITIAKNAPFEESVGTNAKHFRALLVQIETMKKLKSAPIKTEPAKSLPVSVTTVKSETPKIGRVSFELVKPGAKRVCVAGSFNDWQPEMAPLSPVGNGRWAADVPIKPGRHEYLFVVDGQWMPDPNAKESVQNPFGGRNSIVGVSV